MTFLRRALLTRASFLFLVILITTPSVYAEDWSDAQVVRRRGEAVVTYRAKLEGSVLVVEATHAKDWHTYSLDNIERARVKTGKETPETELPTQIEVTGGLEVVGNWHQSPPKDLSQTVIQWYTWGFEDVALFAVPVKRVAGDTVTIVINGQACNASACQMVERVTLTLALTADSEDADGSGAFEGLLEVTPVEADSE